MNTMEDDRQQPQGSQQPPLESTEELGAVLREKFLEFLEAFTEADAAKAANAPVPDDGEAQLYYVNQVHAMKTAEKTTLFVDFCHVDLHDWELARTIETEFLRVETYLRKAVQALVRKHEEAYLESEEQGDREFWVAFYNKPQTLPLRALKTGAIGHLTCFKGTVTRSSEVRPELYLATFKCLECQAEVANVQQQYKFTQPLICPNPTCGNRKSWVLVREKSTFVDWQRVKVQELSDEVPAGSLPRTMDVILRNDIVEAVRAGDKVEFTGALIVVPDISVATAPGERVTTRYGGSKNTAGLSDMGVTGMKSLGVRELTYKLCFAACYTMGAEASGGMVNIRADEELTPEEVLQGFSEADADDVVAMSRDPQVYEHITSSIAPGVHGHLDVKRAIALMLFGGVHKQTAEGINLRGDINVAIVGDPSCAKSQLLKYVAAFLPRAVYTSGKSSSAAGLTATVVKETDSNEFCIEAGALMLADNGICCIDEFDKMDVKDQVAIHEAMEQQTISIAKAGIQATLNARTSILAAANPVSGRYDRSKPLKYNVALPPAILSRFDLMHVMIDEPDEEHDRAVAGHILAVHQLKPQALSAHYSMAQMQRYIKYTRSIKPQLTPQAAKVLVEAYKSLRGEDAQGDASAYRITVRQLEALVRLSEALARAHSQPVITPAFVREATRLVKHSIIAIESGDVAIEDEVEAEDPLAAVRGAAEDAAEAAAPPAADGARPMEEDRAETAGDRSSSPAAPGTPAAAAVGGAAAAAGGKPVPLRISRKQFDKIKGVLLLHLRQVQEEAEAAGDDGAMLDYGINRVAGSPQRSLVSWYFDFLAERGELQVPRPADGADESEEVAWRREVALLERVISHLLAKDNVLVVADTPERREDEGQAEWAQRRIAERVLAVNPNYVDDQ